MEITQRLKEIILTETNVNIEAVTRARNTIELRALYYYLIKKLYPKTTFMEIAESVGKNHATVIHAINNYKVYESYNNDLKLLKETILKEMEKEYIHKTNDNNILKETINKKNNQINDLKQELEIVKEKLTTFTKSEYNIINKLNELLINIKDTELHDVMIIRLQAMYDMNIRVLEHNKK